MPFRELGKKHRKKDVEDKEDVGPSFQIHQSDSKRIPPIQIPEFPPVSQGGSLSARPEPSPKQKKRFSLLDMRHRSSSQNSLPDWNPPDESDPNAERDWEARATKLAKLRPKSLTTSSEGLDDLAKLSVSAGPVRAPQSADGHLLPREDRDSEIVARNVRDVYLNKALPTTARFHEDGRTYRF